MRRFWGLIWAYWRSDSWKEAWALALVIAVLTALASKASVWMAESSGDLVNAIALYHDPENVTPLQSLLTSGGWLLFLVLLKDAGFVGIRHYFSTTLHRKWRGWLNTQFNAALLDGNHTHFHLQHGAVDASDPATVAPDNVDQRVQESIKLMTGGAIGLAMGVAGVLMSLLFVGEKLIETSTYVSGFEFLGAYGSAVLAFVAVALYVPLNTAFAVWLGRLLERLTLRMQQAEGSYRGELTTFLRRSFHIAAAGGESVQKSMHEHLYVDIDKTWASLNKVQASYMSFELLYNFIAARIVAYGPSLVPYMQNKISLKYYVTGAELVNSLISQCSWFIHVMPDIAALKANARRVTDLAEAIENVQRPAEFYGRTGHSEFVYETQNPIFGLTVQNLQVMHQGDHAVPFVTAPHLHFRRGEWTFVKGESGSGKTSIIKAINGLWPYGRGSIVFPEGVKTFYAAQEVKLPRVSLKQLACMPARAENFSDARVAAMLHKAGLGEFIEHLADDGRDGTPWDQLFSGGQKQKLVATRILLQKPGLLFLDEATSALDPEATIAFHQTIKDNCPGITVISIMHEPEPPRSAKGVEFYESVLLLADGIATKKPLVRMPTELTALPGKVVPAPRGKGAVSTAGRTH
jgi:vitamin B12/bleomycin/antimicrobial peptide transport system ATP-binding/permease protein